MRCAVDKKDRKEQHLNFIFTLFFFLWGVRSVSLTIPLHMKLE